MPTFVTTPTGYKAIVRVSGWPCTSRTFPRLGDARHWAAEAEASMRKGAFVDTRPAERTSLAECLERYLAEETPRKKGARQETTLIGRWLRDPLVHRPLTALRPADVARWRDAQAAAGKAASTVTNAMNLLSRVYTLARTEWGLPVENPIAKVRRPAAAPGRDTVLTEDQESTILDACDELGLELLRVFVILAVETAMRRSEILSLRWLDIAGNVAKLRTSKNGRARSVPLSARAVQVLREVQGSLLDLTHVLPISPNTLDKQWRRAARAAGLAGVRVHDLRHTACTRLMERGIDPWKVMAISGHRDPRMLQRYSHISAAKIAEELAA
jgi:integrase